MADLSELWPAIGDILTGDTTLVSLLSSSAAVYFGDDLPRDLRVVLPAIRFWHVGESPAIDRTVIGDHEVRLQIDVFSETPATNEAVRKRLDEILSVPIKRPQGISSASYLVRSMFRTGSVPLSLGRDVSAGGAPLYQLSTDWTLRVNLKA